MSEERPSEALDKERDGDRTRHVGWTRQRNPTWMGGVVLILIGVVFLLRNISGSVSYKRHTPGV